MARPSVVPPARALRVRACGRTRGTRRDAPCAAVPVGPAMSNAAPERAGVARRAERPAAGLLLGAGATLSGAHTPPQAVADRRGPAAPRAAPRPAAPRAQSEGEKRDAEKLAYDWVASRLQRETGGGNCLTKSVGHKKKRCGLLSTGSAPSVPCVLFSWVAGAGCTKAAGCCKWAASASRRSSGATRSRLSRPLRETW